jgi:tetratricopeptide (TPR) repeat protein
MRSNNRNRVGMTNSPSPEKSPRYHREALSYLFVWLLALVTRAVYLWQIRHAPVFTLLLGDATSYDAWARRIANGDWLGQGVFYQAPLYPYFLGALYALFDKNLLAVRLVQIIIGASSCVLLARAGRSFFTQTAGLLAGVLLAVYPTAIFFDGSIQKSVLDLFFVCALLATLGRLWENPQPRWWFGAGVVLALLALTRENALIFLPILLAWLFAAWHGELWTTRLQWAALLLLGLAALLLPVGCRNLLVGGEFHLTTAQFGPNFYIGNGRDATGTYQALRWGHGNAKFERDDATRLAEQATGRKLTPSEVSRYWTAKALDEIHADGSRWMRLLWRKWRLIWNVSEVGDSDDQYTQGDWSSLLRVLNRLLHFGTLCPLAALGVCLTWKQRQRVWLLYAMVLGYAASVMLFYVFSRYRFPLVPMLLLFAAAGLACLPNALREARWGALGTGVTVAVLTASICNRAMVPEVLTRATTHYNIANKLVGQQANSEEAAFQYKEAVRLIPDFEAAHVGLGKLLAAEGRADDAISEYLEALRIKPDYAEAHDVLAVTLARLGRSQEAVGHWEQALRIYPDFAEAHYNLGLALARIDRLPEAMEHWEQAVRIKPDYAEAHYNLGIALEHMGNLPGAIAQYKEALRIQPDFVRAQSHLARIRTHGL